MSEQPHAHHERHNLDRAFVGGMAWTAGAKWLSQLVSWPAVLLCAHFLSPSDYGIVEMSGFYFTVTNVMAEFGIGMAVLQMRELDLTVVRQLNSVAALSGIVAFAISVAVAPLIAQFFRTPELHRLVIIASLSFILTSLEAIPLGLLQRDMDYRRLSVAESFQALLTAVVSMAGAYLGMGYWALVAGNLVGRAGNISLTVYWRPVGFALPRWGQIVSPLKFGMEIAAQRIMGSVSGLSDSMVIGRTLGQSPLGVYRLAVNLAYTPSEKIGTLIMRVTGPLFARVQNDKSLLKRYFLIFSETLSIAIFPLLFGLAVVAPEAVRLLLGPKWAEAASPLRWLAIYYATRTTSYLVNQLLVTLRFTRFGMWISWVNFVAMPVAFYFASSRGIGAVAAAWLVLSPIAIVPPAWKILGAIGCSLWEYIRSLLPAIAGSGAMIVAILALRAGLHIGAWPAYQEVAAEIGVGALAYGGLLWGFHKARIMQYVQFFLQLRRPTAVADAAMAAAMPGAPSIQTTEP